MSIKLLGIEFCVTVPFSVLLTFLLINDRSGMMTVSLCAMTVHEAGHIIAMKVFHCAPKSVRLGLGGILIRACDFCTFTENIIIALSGPFANLLILLILLPVYAVTKSFTVLEFAAVQGIIGFINLLPVKGLDGGTVMLSFLQKVTEKYSLFLAIIFSVFFTILIFLLGIAVIVKNTDNPSLLLLGIYLIILNIIKR